MPEKKNEYRAEAGGRTVHDVGGLDFGAVDFDEHDLALWERRVDAMRRVIESYGEQQYDATTYYEKWARALRNLLVEQNVISREELDAKLVETRAKMRAAGREASSEDVPWNEWDEKK